jgi:hypothetical protein
LERQNHSCQAYPVSIEPMKEPMKNRDAARCSALVEKKKTL